MEHIKFKTQNDTCFRLKRVKNGGVNEEIPYRDIKNGTITAIQFTEGEIQQIKESGKIFIVTDNGFPIIELEENNLILYNKH
jgi:hypothetical protein